MNCKWPLTLLWSEEPPTPGEASRVTVLKGLPASLPPAYKHQLNVCSSLSSV